ncbi:MAG: urease accessory protein UreD [Rhizobiaceae bacterium]
MLARPEQNLPSPLPHQRANGIGRLGLVEANGQTRIDELYQEGCAKIRCPRTHHNQLEAVIINSSGGMTGGDKLNWNFTIGANCKASITTQACERIYKSVDGSAQTRIEIDLNENSQFSWLPQETILFDQSSLSRTIEATLDPTAEALFVESIIFGRREMGEKITLGSITDRWRIRQNGTLVHAEDFRMTGNIADQLNQPFITNRREAMATLLLISPKAEGLLETARNIIGESGGASFWNGKLLARVVSTDGYALRKTLIPLINLLNFGTSVPKVWSL